MMIARNDAPVSWDDLLSAISPQRGFANTDIQRFINAVTTARQEGHITDEELEDLIKMLAAVVMSGQVNAIVGDFFTPYAPGHLGGRFGEHSSLRQGHRRFSLI